MASSIKHSAGKHWWSGLFAPRRTPVPFEVACACGRVLRGYRRRRSQVLPCPVCAKPVFVFPRSPWLANAPRDVDPIPEGPTPAQQLWLRLRTPLLAGAATLIVCVVGFVVLLPYLARPPASTPAAPRSTLAQLNERIDAGRRALADGTFNVAVRELNAAVELRARQPELLTPRQTRDLNQLQRQADLLARLHTVPLEGVLEEAVLARNDDDWRERFDAVHKGHTVLFDDVVRRDAATGRLVLNCLEVRAGGEKAVIALDDLKILQELALNQPQRLIFGGRLKSVVREAGGGWVIHFEPDGGVLLTDANAVTACWPTPPDRDVLRTLQWQEERLRDLPAQRPAP